ncbi:acetyl-CoA hydrolase/transferase family protein [Ramlibacter sp.]|uniref:acetyl-CoA hydrolase/transferase family protein n=1 Tax=Ramlibacter sp. TaxID=1917967 RepID=UPI003D0D93E3
MIELDNPEQLDLTRYIRAGDALVTTQMHAEPVTLVRRLIAQRAAIGKVSIFIGPLLADTFGPEHADFITFRSYCGTARNALLADAGALDPVPTHFSEYPRVFASGAMPCDVAFLALTEPDAQGRFNLGTANDYAVAAARRARVVIAEVMPGLPWMNGAELPDDIRPHVLLRAGAEPVAMPETGEGSDEERAIAANVAKLVPDGATLALGVGSMPNFVMRAMLNHRNLGIHSGAIGEAVVELIESGVVTNESKPVYTGVSVANMLMGSRRLLAYAHRNPRLRVAPTSFTHDIANMRDIPRFFSVSSGVEIDLTGQVNGEIANGRYIGAVGGAGDFVRGANLSPGGASIMMFSSTARRGKVSRIVARLSEPVVTTPRSDVQYVVTEFGIADLRGKSLKQRIEAMIPLAHPDFRDPLARDAGLAVA